MVNLYYRFFPQQIDDKPPVLYRLLDSICNASPDDIFDIWDNNEPVKIFNLAENARGTVFKNCNYPLYENVSRETFETDILNHFIMRRIGFQTFTAFKIALNNRLREIMPKYNLLFALFEKKLDLLTDDKTEDYTQKTNNTNVNNGDYTTNQNGGFETNQNGGFETNVTGNYKTDVNGNTRADKGGTYSEGESYQDIEDLRYSDTPQNRLNDVKSGEYVSEYHYNTRDGHKNKDGSHTDVETTTHTDNTDNTHSDKTVNTHTDTTVNTHTDTTDNVHSDTDVFDGLIKFEKIVHDTSDKIAKLLDLQNELVNIMTQIYNDLDCLFYQIVD